MMDDMGNGDEKGIFCQVDANLDWNPKIRNAGRDGRDVFEFVLRVNAQRGFHGWIPVAYLRPQYLADLLMMTTDEARHGVTASVTAELLWFDQESGQVHIVGWSPQWGKEKNRGKSDAERSADYRTRKKLKVQLSLPSGVTESRDVTDRHVTRHAASPRHARGEERRVEERIRDPRGPDWVESRSSSSQPPDLDGGRDLVHGEVRQCVAVAQDQTSAPVSHLISIPQDPRVEETKRLLRNLIGLHVQAFNAVRAEVGAKVPAMQPLGDPTERALRTLIEAQVSLSGFEERCLHVLDVRHAEAKRTRSVKFFGQTVWDPDSFGRAVTMEVGETRTATRVADIRYGNGAPTAASIHERDALLGEGL